jgi:hypothetical protein
MTNGRSFDTAAKRWAGVGPYYAMFPAAFADAVVAKYTDKGDVVLDPFAGRGTSIYSAAVQGRHGVGIELNPVGWIYARTKLSPASKEDVTKRFEMLGARACRYADEAKSLPTFFHRCFSRSVRRFLLAARTELNWRRSNIDRTAMALLLVNLHGKRDASLSNQMRQTKAMSPDYSIAWWDERDMTPPLVDPVDFMVQRIEWRYAKGVPMVAASHMYLGDNSVQLTKLKNGSTTPKARLLFTSPPYYGLTNYHYDQWLRLWLLGGPPNALRVAGRNRGRFEHEQRYRQLLIATFRKAADCLSDDSIVYIRTGSDKVTRAATREALTVIFPNKKLREYERPFEKPTQTQLFGGVALNAGEVDQVMLPA